MVKFDLDKIRDYYKADQAHDFKRLFKVYKKEGSISKALQKISERKED